MMDGAGDVTGSYDKVFLMVFGEYIPFYDADPLVHEAVPGGLELQPRQRAGVVPAATSAAGDYRAGPAHLLRGHPARRSRGAWPSSGPNAFINITNDAWFGRTAEPYQHLALAVFRSVEHRLEMVRAVNTGVSAHIDAAGRVRAQTESVDPRRPAAAAAQDAAGRAGDAPRAAGSTGTSAICSGSLCLAGAGACFVAPLAPGASPAAGRKSAARRFDEASDIASPNLVGHWRGRGAERMAERHQVSSKWVDRRHPGGRRRARSSAAAATPSTAPAGPTR